MGITFLLSSFYLWYNKVPDFPFGAPGVRPWLILRACFGFGGLFCLYCTSSPPLPLTTKFPNNPIDSVHYLPLAEATVFRFLVPICTALACFLFLGELFTLQEFIAGLVALVGVIIIAHPSFIFGSDITPPSLTLTKAGDVDAVTPTQRLIAIGASILGVVGAAGAYTTIRVIGSRAHALMSVNYFAFIATLSSTLFLLLVPGISFTMPHGARQWVLLILLGIWGFILQFLLTAGLQLDRSSKATSMLYTQILMALGFDWAIWGVLPGGWSVFGGCIVIASTLWSALQKPRVSKKEEGKVKVVDEESALLGAQTEGTEEAVRRGSVTA
jgi:drug/metabolite transporter (DMT)-like permease